MRTQLCLTPNSPFFLVLLDSIQLKPYGQDEGFKIGSKRYLATRMCLARSKYSGNSPFPLSARALGLGLG